VAIEVISDEKQSQGNAERVFAALQKAPGMQYVYNRLGTVFEKFFDGIPYTFEPHKHQALPDYIAEFMYRTSVIKLEPETGEAVRALVTPEDSTFGVPYDIDPGLELISREVTDNYVQRGTDGVPTKAKVVSVKGGGFDQGRRAGPTSRV
jgi:hypothetical protein